MKWILLISGFVILFSVCILYVIKLKKLLKEDLDDYHNANHLSIEKQSDQIKEK